MIRACFLAVGFLSRLWTPEVSADERSVAQSLAWFPAVGLLLGLLSSGVLLLAEKYLGQLVGGALAVVTMAWLSGALHLDGLADTVDGLSAGRGDRERALRVMSDSRIGAHGAVALVLALGLKMTLVTRILERGQGTLFAGMSVVHAMLFSRLCCAICMTTAKPAKTGGLTALFRVPRARTWAMLGLVWGVAALLIGHWVLPTEIVVQQYVGAFAGVGVSCLIAWRATRSLGGVTGDTLGALLEVSEIAILMGWGFLC